MQAIDQWHKRISLTVQTDEEHFKSSYTVYAVGRSRFYCAAREKIEPI